MQAKAHTCKRKQFVIKLSSHQYRAFCSPCTFSVSSSRSPCYQFKSKRDKRHQDSQSLLKISLSASACQMPQNTLFSQFLCVTASPFSDSQFYFSSSQTKYRIVEKLGKVIYSHLTASGVCWGTASLLH